MRGERGGKVKIRVSVESDQLTINPAKTRGFTVLTTPVPFDLRA